MVAISVKEMSPKIDSAIEELVIKHYIDKYIELEKSMSVHEVYRQDFIKDYYPSLVDYWNEKRKEKIIGEINLDAVEEILKKVRNGWGNEDEFILNNLTPNIYKEYILKSPSFVKNIVSFLLNQNKTKHFNEAVENIKKALITLRDEKDDYKFKVDKICNKAQIALEEN